LLVLIDESGDPGFKIAKGSSPMFVVAMAIFNDFSEAEKASEAINKARTKFRVKPEFKFNKCHPDIKDGFFDAVCPFNFTVRALVVDKSKVYSDNLRTCTNNFYNYFVQMLMRHDNAVLQDACIKIDGSGDRKFKRELGAYLRRELGSGRVKDIKFADSHKNNLIQLADMVAGAIARAHNPVARKNANRWLEMLTRSGKIDDVWMFK